MVNGNTILNDYQMMQNKYKKYTMGLADRVIKKCGSIGKAANLLFVSGPTIGGYRSGKCVPPKEMVMRMLDILGEMMPEPDMEDLDPMTMLIYSNSDLADLKQMLRKIGYDIVITPIGAKKAEPKTLMEKWIEQHWDELESSKDAESDKEAEDD